MKENNATRLMILFIVLLYVIINIIVMFVTTNLYKSIVIGGINSLVAAFFIADKIQNIIKNK